MDLDFRIVSEDWGEVRVYDRWVQVCARFVFFVFCVAGGKIGAGEVLVRARTTWRDVIGRDRSARHAGSNLSLP